MQKNTSIKIRLSKQEKLEWKRKAETAGISIANLVRTAMKKTRTWTVSDRTLVQEKTRQISRIGNNLNQIAKWANTYKSTAETDEVVECLKAIKQSLEQLSEKTNKNS